MKTLFLLCCSSFMSMIALSSQTLANCDKIIETPDEKAFLSMYQEKDIYDRWHYTNQEILKRIYTVIGPRDTTYTTGKVAILEYVVDHAGILGGLQMQDKKHQEYLPLIREALQALPSMQPARVNDQSVCSKASIMIPLTHVFDPLLQQEITATPYQMPVYHPEKCGALDRAEQQKCSQEGLIADLYQQLTYPAAAIKEGAAGMVVIHFIIDRNGQAVSHRILRDIGSGCGEAALAAAQYLSDWTPAYDENGQALNVQITLPVRFALEGGKKVRKQRG